MTPLTRFIAVIATPLAAMLASTASAQSTAPIVHDAEYYVLEAQHRQRWQSEDATITAKLAEIREQNGGKRPNIVYILLDDVGFGELGMRDLSVTRGYETPRIDAFAKQSLTLERMYTEPSCTPTRVAMMTGRYPTRTGLVEAKSTLSGEGLAAEEVTLAEVLKQSGYYTSHVGKWHMGDIEQGLAHKQGFMHAEFPIHQQAQLALMHAESEAADITRGIDMNELANRSALDQSFIPSSSHMVTGVELRDGKLYEIDLQPGEAWSQQKYWEMNERYQSHALEQLRVLAAQDKPFYLNYWPLFPITFTRSEIEEYKTLNGGSMAESIVGVDGYVGAILDEIDKLGIADNTIVMVMGDNGPFMQYAGPTGQSDRIYRGGKGQHLEGGVRVNAWIRWPAAIEPGTYANDIVHVSDLFTTFARVGVATGGIPRDRVIDGLDQTGILLLGQSHGRRDYVHIYEEHALRSVVKDKYKMHLAPPGTNPILSAKFFDLYRDPRESRPGDSIKYGPSVAGSFGAMIGRHMAMKQKYPDRKLPHAIPYEGIENLRPESKALVDAFTRGAGGH